MKNLLLPICLLFIAGITPVLAGKTPSGFSADYQLTFNNEKVGQAYFRLEIQGGQKYNFEVFTMPTGKVASAAGKLEVLEASMGQLKDGIPVPDSYYYAIRRETGTELLEYFYDWNKMLLTIKSADKQESINLAPGTQDRLSYLLYAMLLADSQKAAAEFPLSTPDNTAKTRLRFKNKQYSSLPAGRLLLQEVEQYRGSGSKKPDRTLWLAANKGYVPALIENRTAKGTVRMELLNLGR